MSRLVIALIFVVALVGSFLAVRWAERGQSPPPAAVATRAQTPAAGQAATPAAPPTPEATAKPGPAEPGASEAQSKAFMGQVAEAARAQEEAVRKKIMAPLSQPGTSVDEKLELYQKALRDAFEGTPKEHLLQYRGAFTEIFLRADAVQKELAALAPGDREAELAHIRREMGFSDAQVAQLEKQDAQREARWQNGLAYMQARQRATQSFQGQALQDELQHLRQQYFGIAAKTIALEEQHGFFRFERPRVYGVN